MTLWIILTLMTAIAAAGLTVPLVRRYGPDGRGRTAVGILQDQLAELEAQVASGVIGESEAEALGVEIKRRILTEGRQPAAGPARPIAAGRLIPLALGLAAILSIAATLLYARIGRPDLPAHSGIGGGRPVAGGSGDIAAADHPGGDLPTMIGQLQHKLEASPNDPEGWRMLGWALHEVGRFPDSAAAYAKAAALDPANGDDLSAGAESLVKGAGGQVTPEALAVFRKALAVDPADPRARYFIGVQKDQQGDHKGAIADWIALLKSAPPGAPWAAEVRALVEKIAAEHGENLSGRLPPAAAGSAPEAAGDNVAPGPTPAQAAAAQQMSPSDQQAMIQGMVSGLQAKLKAQPRDPDGWVRLMRAHMVLGDSHAAATDLHDAVGAYADTPPQQAALRNAARQLGVPGA